MAKHIPTHTHGTISPDDARQLAAAALFNIDQPVAVFALQPDSVREYYITRSVMVIDTYNEALHTRKPHAKMRIVMRSARNPYSHEAFEWLLYDYKILLDKFTKDSDTEKAYKLNSIATTLNTSGVHNMLLHHGYWRELAAIYGIANTTDAWHAYLLREGERHGHVVEGQTSASERRHQGWGLLRSQGKHRSGPK